MLRCVRRHQVIGCEVVDREGEFVGSVLDTAPLDGGGEVEMLLLEVGRRFPRRRYVPAQGIGLEERKLRLPVLRDEVEDGPGAEDRRWGDPADLARSYWMFATD